jgi:dCTP deaminase
MVLSGPPTSAATGSPARKRDGPVVRKVGDGRSAAREHVRRACRIPANRSLFPAGAPGRDTGSRPGAGGACGIFDPVLISDRDIRAELDSKRIVLEPFDPAMVQPSSVDVRIDRLFRLFDNHKYAHIDPAEDQPELTRLVEVASGEPFILHPGEFVLGSTYETVTLPDDIAARLEGKSSLGRLGLMTHSTAGFIDPGFSGHVTLELANVATLPIKLYPGMKIGQFCFFRLSSPSEHPYGSEKYGSRYQGQRGPTPSRSFQNFHRTPI